MTYARFAVFVTPPPGPLADFGASWLGWDSAAGRVRAHPDCGALPRPVAEITRTPRKYGFHGTIKPPFRLAGGCDPAGLQAAFAAFCATEAPVEAGPLEVAEMGPFLALRPAAPSPALDGLAARTVAGLDRFRAPSEAAELARRRKAGLSPQQEALLTRWGYPYVMEAFRYHMTLTGPLAPDERAVVAAALRRRLAPLLPETFAITHLTLLGAAADGRFHQIRRAPLVGVLSG